MRRALSNRLSTPPSTAQTRSKYILFFFSSPKLPLEKRILCIPVYGALPRTGLDVTVVIPPSLRALLEGEEYGCINKSLSPQVSQFFVAMEKTCQCTHDSPSLTLTMLEIRHLHTYLFWLEASPPPTPTPNCSPDRACSRPTVPSHRIIVSP
jgi:hypothetical protein